MKVVIVSGGFDPVRGHHMDLFENAKMLGDVLAVILNSDDWLDRKKGFHFLQRSEREKIIKSIKYVDVIINSIDTDDSVSRSIEYFVGALSISGRHEFIFANGGDRKKDNDIPELEVCKKYKVKMVFNVGGEKPKGVKSGVELVEDAARKRGMEYGK